MEISNIFAFVNQSTNKYNKNMENTEVNIRGSIKCLEVNEKVCLPKSICKPSVVRSTATTITLDTGKKFSVAATEDEHNIIVTRTA